MSDETQPGFRDEDGIWHNFHIRPGDDYRQLEMVRDALILADRHLRVEIAEQKEQTSRWRAVASKAVDDLAAARVRVSVLTDALNRIDLEDYEENPISSDVLTILRAALACSDNTAISAAYVLEMADNLVPTDPEYGEWESEDLTDLFRAVKAWRIARGIIPADPTPDA